MPRFEVRLESPDRFRDGGDPHYRLTRLVADDKDAAEAQCRRKEYEIAAFQLSADEVERLEGLDELKGNDKGRLNDHVRAGDEHQLAPDLDADDFRDDRTTGELSNATGYTTGGVTLASVAVTYDSASDQVRFDCADPSWTFTADRTWRYGDIYKSRGGASSADELLANLDWGSDQTVNTVYTLAIDSTGLLYIDVT